MEIESNDENTGNEIAGFVHEGLDYINDKETPFEHQEFPNEVQEENVKCSKCEIEEAKNECKRCENFICSKCEIKVHGESVLEFMNTNKFLNYECNLVH